MLYLVLAIIALGILIIVHELGHFIAARLSGVWVERFSIGFGPKIISATRGNTEYALSLIPLGGYVKLHRMTEDEEAVEGKEKEAFFNKPYRFKVFVITAGVLFNILFAVLLLSAAHMIGDKTHAPVISHIDEGYGETFKPMDKILSVNGKAIRTWDEFLDSIVQEPLSVKLERGGEVVTLDYTPRSFIEKEDLLGDKFYSADTGLHLYIPAVVGSVTTGFPAKNAGILPGDNIVDINGVPVNKWDDISRIIKESAGELEITVARGVDEKKFTVNPKEADGRFVIGIVASKGNVKVSYPLPAAIYLGAKQTVLLTKLIFAGIGKLVAGKINRDSIGGPIMIVNEGKDSAKAGAISYLLYMAFISINLAVLNILPIPILDGGHVVLYTIEKVFSRRVGQRLRESSQMVGMALLGLLMVYAVYNDVLRLLK